MKKEIIFLVLGLCTSFATLQAQVWTQIGVDISGESLDDRFGSSISLSSDGTLIAIGACQANYDVAKSGYTKIYKNQDGIWTQVGAKIIGEADGDYSGKVSLSADGSVVAIGASGNSGNGYLSGHVRIYKNQSGTWAQVGADIDGEAGHDMSGWSLSLNSDGSVVAIGSPINSPGRVRIYKNQSGNWTKIGTDIVGDANDNQFGHVVSINADGSIVGIVARNGFVRIYNNLIGTWTQLGSDIEGGDVSLSSDGSIVAVGYGSVSIYKNINGTWTQIDSDIEAGGLVSLSSDGSHVAISDISRTRIYQNKDGAWVQIGHDIDGKLSGDREVVTVSLNANGSVVAIGEYESFKGTQNVDKGNVRIYELLYPPKIITHPISQQNICPGANVSFTVEGTDIESYQWQVDLGLGYENIAESGVYSNTTKATLNITGALLDMNNNQYRCVVSNSDGNTISNAATFILDIENPLIICVGDQTIDADATHFYTVNDTEFDPISTSDNCGVATVKNSFNNLATLGNAQIPEGTTLITWSIADNNGNENTCSHNITVRTFVGIETLRQKGIYIYPNSKTGLVNINAKYIQKISVYDITGKLIIEKKNVYNNITIDLSNFGYGFYLVGIQIANEVFTTKFLKE